MCLCVHVCVYFVCVCVCMYIFACMCTCVFVCLYLFVCLHVYMYVCVYVCVCIIVCVFVCVYLFVCLCVPSVWWVSHFAASLWCWWRSDPHANTIRQVSCFPLSAVCIRTCQNRDNTNRTWPFIVTCGLLYSVWFISALTLVLVLIAFPRNMTVYKENRLQFCQIDTWNNSEVFGFCFC